MTYNELAKTFEMLAAHMPNGMVLDWAKRDQWGIKLKGFELTPSEIRMLAEMGWCLGRDIDYNEEEMAAWNNPQSASDEELVALFNNYKSIYQYAAYII